MKAGYTRIARCQGHSSYVNHLDWSRDSRVIQSNDGAYEMLYFDSRNGRQVQDGQRDTTWDTWTCTLGFPVMGIWRLGEMDAMDGTDINAVCRSSSLVQFEKLDPCHGRGAFVVTADDDGFVRLHNYPCVIESSPCREYLGHSSHVTAVRFSPCNRWVCSAGGHDRAIFQWRVVPCEDEEPGPIRPTRNEVFRRPKRLLTEETLVDGAAPVSRIPLQELGQSAGAAAAAAAGGGAGAAIGAGASAAEVPAVVKAGEAADAHYEVIVHTSDRRGAGTDANVYLTIYGEKGKQTPEYRLDNASNNFERGRVDS